MGTVASRCDEEVMLQEVSDPWFLCYACGAAKMCSPSGASSLKCDVCHKSTTLSAWQKRPRITHSPSIYNETLAQYKQAAAGSAERAKLARKPLGCWQQIANMWSKCLSQQKTHLQMSESHICVNTRYALWHPMTASGVSSCDAWRCVFDDS